MYLVRTSLTVRGIIYKPLIIRSYDTGCQLAALHESLGDSTSTVRSASVNGLTVLPCWSALSCSMLNTSYRQRVGESFWQNVKLNGYFVSTTRASFTPALISVLLAHFEKSGAPLAGKPTAPAVAENSNVVTKADFKMFKCCLHFCRRNATPTDSAPVSRPGLIVYLVIDLLVQLAGQLLF